MENLTHQTNRNVTHSASGGGIYRSLIDRMLAPLNQGKLHVTFPDGSTKFYGGATAEPSASIHIRKNYFFKKCILSGDIGLGESYMDGDWDTDSIVKVISWFIHNLENAPTVSGSRRKISVGNFLRFFNRLRHNFRHNSQSGSRRNITEHYDLSNDFFRVFLDDSMTYSSAFFSHPDDSLEAAQTEKYDRLCRKLNLQASDSVLEIGSGWGGFAAHAASKYGCKIHSITVSDEQLKYARERIKNLGLENHVTFELKDYRNLSGQYDKIVSIEMLEAIGHRYLKTFFAKCHQVLKRDGLLGFQVITCADVRYDEYRKSVDWIQKHIFPGGLLPSIGVLNQSINATGDMHLHHLEEMGLHYAETLHRWNVKLNEHLDAVQKLGFDRRFQRKWKYYFEYCEAAFRMRNVSVVQAVYTRPNNLKA